ncbi:MAG: CrcB family protein [Cyanobacteria bacterium K_DeepCast_35m_m2_155]|nr:CrcB family protein [Cyanobacteria bacterium K_DeepCast_35m_m2_155]
MSHTSPPPPRLQSEFKELALVAGGAIPGALLRWQLEGAATAWVGGLKGLIEGDFSANMLGCLLLGLLLGRPRPRARLMLWAGIGLCGSLTTFSSWMLELVRALDRGDASGSLQVLFTSLLAGLALMALGQWLGRQLDRQSMS